MAGIFRKVQIFRNSIFILVIVLNAMAKPMIAQNLVPNHSFEVFTTCPITINQNTPLECVPWYILAGSPDYFNSCADPNLVGVPSNFQGYQPAQDGVAYLGFYTWTTREFAQVQLLDTLEAGHCYKLSFWINLINEGCGIDQIGGLLTASPGEYPLGMSPQVDYGGQFYSDTVEWINILGYFTAVGNEEYLTVGNFYSDNDTHVDPACTLNPPFSYYYADNFLLEEVPFEQVFVDLGPPVTACDSFIIDPGGDPDVVYYWSTGAIGPTLTVHSSGTYSVTASYGCSEDFSEIDVTIIHPHSMDLGPDAVLICNGDDYEISLDPDEGTYEWNDGSSDSDYTITIAGTYSVTLDDGCTLSGDTVDVTVMDLPLVFSLGPDTFICPGFEYIIVLDPALGNFQWQDNSNESTYTIDNDGTYSLTISNECGEETDEMEVIAYDFPVVYLGPDSTILCDDVILEWDFDPDQGIYIWHDGSTNPFYSTTISGSYGVTVTNNCGLDSADMYVTTLVAPYVELGPSIQDCDGDVIVLDAGPDADFYQWQDGSTAQTFLVTTDGSYSVTVSNTCGQNEDSVEASFLNLVMPPDLGPDISLCPGDIFTLHATSVGASYVWNDLSTADSLIVNAAGTYFVRVFNACSSYSDTLLVSMNTNAPVLNLPADFPLCLGATDTIDAGITGVTYLWNDGSMLPLLPVFAPGTYSLLIANACGTDNDTIVIMDGGPLPLVSLSMDTAICQGTSISIVPTFSNVNTWLWQDGSTQPTLTASNAGPVFVQAANACGVTSDTMEISFLSPAPILDLGPDQVMCPGDSLTFSISPTGVSIMWSDGSVNPDLIVTDSMTVYATIGNSCGTSVDSVYIILLPEIPALNLGTDQTICPGVMFTVSPGIPNVNYLWQNGSTNPTYLVSQGELITLTISNICGQAIDSLLITESSIGPQIDLGPDTLACEGEIITIPAGIAGVTYEWQDGSTGDDFVTSVSGTIILTVSNLCGTDIDTVEVVINGVQPVPNLGNDTTLCEGVSLLLKSQSFGLTSFHWQDGSTSPTYLITSAGTYTLFETNRCGDAKDSIVVSYMNGPAPFNLGPDTILCPGESIVLFAPITTDVILWQNGSSQSSIIADQAFVYSLAVSNSCGSVSDDLVVDINTDQPQIDFPQPPLWCPGDEFTFDATQPFDAYFLWSTGEITSSIVVSTPGVYSVEVDATCLSASQSFEVIQLDDCTPALNTEIFIPNIFSPNGDDINDVFMLHTDTDIVFTGMEGTIFDRWGNMVFYSITIPFEWDGNFNEETTLPGVYVYLLKVRYQVEGKEFVKVFSGDVTLVR